MVSGKIVSSLNKNNNNKNYYSNFTPKQMFIFNVLISCIKEVRNIVGRLIWESEDEQSVKPVSTPKYYISTQAYNKADCNHPGSAVCDRVLAERSGLKNSSAVASMSYFHYK